MTKENTTEDIKTCLECNQPLGAGRRDRKFCNDICRTAFNNKRRLNTSAELRAVAPMDETQARINEDMAAIEKVYGILVSNRIKLYNLYHMYERRCSLEDFQRSGINLKFFTSEHTDDYYEKLFRMCFDYGYHIDGDRVYFTYYGNEIHFY
jgi:hypothetical protein